MKINPVSSYGIAKSGYMKSAVKRPVPTPAQAENGGKTDTVSFSAGARGQRSLGQVSSRILSEINNPENPSRLQKIQQAIENNTYRVSTDDLADAILGRSVI